MALLPMMNSIITVYLLPITYYDNDIGSNSLFSPQSEHNDLKPHLSTTCFFTPRVYNVDLMTSQVCTDKNTRKGVFLYSLKSAGNRGFFLMYGYEINS